MKSTERSPEPETKTKSKSKPASEERADQLHEKGTEPDDELPESEVEAEFERKEKAKISYHASLGVDEAIAYFEAILKGLRKGSLDFRHEDTVLELTPRDRVELEVKAARKGRKEKLTFELSWASKDQSKLEIE